MTEVIILTESIIRTDLQSILKLSIALFKIKIFFDDYKFYEVSL